MKGYCANHVTFDIVRMRENVMTEHVHARYYLYYTSRTQAFSPQRTRLARYYTDELAPPTALHGCIVLSC